MANTEEAQRKIALLYAERNRLYESLPSARLVLCLGSGSGSFLRRYSHPHALILCVDRGEPEAGYPAWGPKHKGFEGFAKLAPDGRAVCVKGDLLDVLPRLPPGVFDMAILGQLVEHFTDRDLELVLHEVGRVLLPWGLVQVDTVTELLGEDTHGHEQRFTEASLRAVLERAAFKRIECFAFAEGTALWASARRPS